MPISSVPRQVWVIVMITVAGTTERRCAVGMSPRVEGEFKLGPYVPRRQKTGLKGFKPGLT